MIIGAKPKILTATGGAPGIIKATGKASPLVAPMMAFGRTQEIKVTMGSHTVVIDVPNDWPSFSTEWSFDTYSEGISYNVISATAYEWFADVSGKWRATALNSISDKNTLSTEFRLRYKFTYKDTGGSPGGLSQARVHFTQNTGQLGNYAVYIYGPEWIGTDHVQFQVRAEPDSDTSSNIAVDPLDMVFYLELSSDGAAKYTLKVWTDDFDGSNLIFTGVANATTTRTWNGFAHEDRNGGGPSGSPGTDDFKYSDCHLIFY